MELFKVYAVQSKFIVHKPSRSMFGELFDQIYHIDPNIYTWDTVAIFSQREEAEKYLKEGVFPFDDEIVDKRIADWKVDYELYWKEWNKLEEVKNPHS